MASFEEMTPDTLDDMATYANHAINDIRDLQDRLRNNARRLGFHGAFLAAAADMLDDVIHDELADVLTLIGRAMESGIPQANFRSARIDYDREIARAAE